MNSRAIMPDDAQQVTAVFGGTFDPPHNGHVAIAKAVLDAALASKVLFVPAAAPPHKPGRPVATFAQRFDMLSLAIVDEPSFSLSDVERRSLPEPSYTIMTMTELRRERPDERLILLIGADSLLNLHSWRDARDLVSQWEVVTYPRQEHQVTLEKLSTQWPSATARQLFRSVADLPMFEASSTEIRRRIAARESVDGLLHLDVWNYIVKHGLYRGDGLCPNG